MDNIKYNYIRSGDLCVTIGSKLIRQDDTVTMLYGITFKHPKDKFAKQVARDLIQDQFRIGRVAEYTETRYINRHEMLLKYLVDVILADFITKEYEVLLKSYMNRLIELL